MDLLLRTPGNSVPGIFLPDGMMLLIYKLIDFVLFSGDNK